MAAWRIGHAESPPPDWRGVPSEQTWGFRQGDRIVPGRTVMRLLGGGHRYEAYLAFDDALYALVVVKILRPCRLSDPAALAGMEMEAGAAAVLDHPALVRCFDAVLAGERPHLVLEFLDGPRLSTLLRRYGPLQPEQLLSLALRVCSALHFMGSRGWVHLDVKPRNLIVGAEPRLIDLSIARPIRDARQVSAPIGTDAYMAPEQCDPHRFGHIGPRTDVWGLGVTLFEACTGHLPFSRPAGTPGQDPEPFPQLWEDPAPLVADVPSPLSDAILRCLDLSPDRRPTPAEMAATLELVLAALPRRRILTRLRPR